MKSCTVLMRRPCVGECTKVHGVGHVRGCANLGPYYSVKACAVSSSKRQRRCLGDDWRAWVGRMRMTACEYCCFGCLSCCWWWADAADVFDLSNNI